MRQTCYHALRVWQEFGVKVPVLCAIGCGAFKGSVQTVPESWAQAMASLLSQYDFGFDFVVISLPTFDCNNIGPFTNVFRRWAGRLKVPVVLSDQHGVTSLAYTVSRTLRLRSGLLNPSDVVALRLGFIGMYWNGGHIALEELLATQTTLLLHHGDLNPSKYKAVETIPLPADWNDR